MGEQILASSKTIENSDIVSDGELISAILREEPVAFERFVRQFQPVMTQFAMTFVAESEAEECVQDALIDAILQISKFNQRSSLKTWVLSITANKAKMQLRKNGKEVSLDELKENNLFPQEHYKDNGHWTIPPTHWEDCSPEELMGFEQFRECLDKTVENLPENQKSVMMLRDFIGASTEEICDILELSHANLRVLIHRSRNKVYQMIDHFEQTGEC